MRKEYKNPQIRVIDMKCQYGYLQDFGMSGQEGNPPEEIMSKKHTGFSFDCFEEEEDANEGDNKSFYSE